MPASIKAAVNTAVRFMVFSFFSLAWRFPGHEKIAIVE
jgi:hypothetical protein